MRRRRRLARVPVAADHPSHAVRDRGDGGFVEALPGRVAEESDREVLQARAERIQLAEQFERGVRGLEERGPHVTQPVPRAADFLARRRNAAPQLRRLVLEGDDGPEVRARLGRGHRFHLERLRPSDFPRAIGRDHDELRGVGARGDERPLGRSHPRWHEAGHREVDRIRGRGPQVPAHAVQSLPRGAGDPAHGPAARIGDCDEGPRPALRRLLVQHVVAGERHISPGRSHLPFGGAAGLRHRRRCLGQVVGDHGAEVRVRRGVVVRPERRLAARLHGHGRDVPPRVAHREQRAALRRARDGVRALGEFAQRGVVVEHVEAAAEGRPDHVVVPPLDLQIPVRDRGAREHVPVLAPVHARVHPELGSEEEEVRVQVVLLDRPQDRAVRQVAGDRLP